MLVVFMCRQYEAAMCRIAKDSPDGYQVAVDALEQRWVERLGLWDVDICHQKRLSCFVQWPSTAGLLNTEGSTSGMFGFLPA